MERELIMNSEVGRLATKVGLYLRNCRQRFSTTPILEGGLALGSEANPTNVTAQCRFEFYENWRRCPPTLWCDEKWIRRPGGHLTTNWHILGEGNFCYVLRPEWIETLVSIENQHGNEAALVASAHYILNNTRYLLYHHLLGYRYKLNDWLKEWPDYPHGPEAALKAYEKAKKAGKL